MFRHLFIGIVASLVSAGAAAVVYKWVDEDGVVHFSDQPMEGAEIIELPKSTRAATMPPPPVNRAARSSGTSSQQGGSAAGQFSYASVSFASPASEQTLWNIQGTLNVTLNLQPSLRNGDRLRIYFDGEPQQVDAVQFQLDEVWRGEHNLQAEVLSPTGKVMIRSEPIRFFVQQTTVINN